MSLTKFNGTLINQFDSSVYGNAAVGRKVGVYLAGTDIKADLTDRLGNVIGNPVTTGSRGEYSFWIESGFYDLSLDEGAIDINGNDISQKVTFQPIYPVGADTAELIDISAFTGQTFTMPKTVTGLILFMNGRLLPESEYTFNQQLQVVTLVNVTSTLSDSFTVMVDSGGIGVNGSGNTYYFVSVTDARVQSGFNSGDIVRTGGYYAENDGGDAQYAVRAAGWPVLPVAFKDHILPTGGYLDLIQSSDEVVSAQWGVNKSQAANSDALQACMDYANASDGITYKKIILPAGEIFLDKPMTGFNLHLEGQGWWATQLQYNANITVFTVESSIVVRDLMVANTAGLGNEQGIIFSTPQTDNTNAQWAYSEFDNVYCFYADFSWWVRASVWVNWKNCYSNSLVGIRFARNANPYDVTSPAPAGWNLFSPSLGWFHNMNRIDNFISIDKEVGIWGCPMGTVIHATTQGQNGDKATNKILPVTLERTGIYLEGGGNQNGKGNVITAHYAEYSDVQLRLQDVNSLVVNYMFSQGGAIDNRAHAVIVADSSTVEILSSDGQDWYSNKLILTNNSTVIGDVGGAVGGTGYQIDSTSRWNKGGRHEAFIDKKEVSYGWDAGNTWPSVHGFLVPDGIAKSLGDRKVYEVIASGVFNGTVPYIYNYTVYVYGGSIAPAILLNNKIVQGGGFSDVLIFEWSEGADTPFFKVRIDAPHTATVMVRRLSDMRSFTETN